MKSANKTPDGLTILVVDDDTGHRTMLKTLLTDWGYTIFTAANGEEAVRACIRQPFSLVLMDVRMPRKNGLEALKEIKNMHPEVPILIMTAFSNVEVAVEAIKTGAHDYLTKPLDFEKLSVTLDNIFAFVELQEENFALNSALTSALAPAVGSAEGLIIGRSTPMKQLMEMVATIAPSEATILITGESGTGKELIAKALHMGSLRSSAPYIAFNCAAITESLMESELFGHEKGAFTGADKRREGRFEQADKGSIFLDEIGEMPILMQAKLLRVLQERELQRVGGEKTVHVDVRVITATNRDLEREVREGRFREDLFYRLNVVALNLPPLRERGDDITLLAQHFLVLFAAKNNKRIYGFSPVVLDALMHYSWPGNVRELENIVERAVVLALGDRIEVRDLPSQLHTTLPHRSLFSLPEPTRSDSFLPASSVVNSKTDTIIQNNNGVDQTLEDMERTAIYEVLRACEYNKSEAAKRLGISRKTLYVKLEKYGNEP